jgi:crossover junction endodeoxyribonuclease RuvC
MAVILGIDPGSQITGYGIIKAEGQSNTYLASGCIKVSKQHPGYHLKQIFEGLTEIITAYQPIEVGIEQIFMHRNPNSAIKLGEARGVAIVAATLHSLPISEYSARQVKQSVVGYGAAKKEQVQQMVKYLLKLSGVPQADAADALAVALCHAHSRLSFKQLPQRKRIKRGRLR